MPYYIYRIKPFTQLDQLEVHDTFKQASAQAKSLRAEIPAGSPNKIKVIFADDPLQAEDLLCEVRVAGPKGDD